jgi:RNA polymerase sigma-54 factor
MLKHRQGLYQKQSLQQKLSPQQIQYIKMLQMTTQAVEMRVKEELEINPTLEDPDNESYQESTDNETDQSSDSTNDESGVQDDKEVNWDDYHSDSVIGGSGSSSNWNPDYDDWRDLPTPYEESQLEKLENQVMMLDLSEKQRLIADQILGSIDDDGYFRRDLAAVADGIAFQTGIPVKKQEAEEILHIIQRLDPPGIASRNLRECLIIQLEVQKSDSYGRKLALDLVQNHWEDFEKKHFEKIIKRMGIDEEDFKEAYECLKTLDPKPGSFETHSMDAGNYITPDFEVYFKPAILENGDEDETDGEFIITLHRRNMPELRVSAKYERMLKDFDKSGQKDKETQQTRNFIKDKLESARWFMEMLRQRKETLMNVMKTIVSLQESFFKTGTGIRPMILKDVAERVNLDISTISRVVNGKYVQTPFGVFELRYFFNEGITTESGEDISNLEVKKLLAEIIDNEPKNKPWSDEKLTSLLNEKGFQLARRTVTKYREQLKYPPARLRKMLV